MTPPTPVPAPLEHEEYIEQAYLFRTVRERMAQSLPAQDILARVRDELLSTTRLPMAIDFLATEMKHAGVLAPAMQRLGHYFTPFQALVIGQAETEDSKFSMELALEVLEREAAYKSRGANRAGLFVYQFETVCRNRLGYDAGLQMIAADPAYDEAWSDWIRKLRSQLGTIDFADLVYARSEYAQIERRRRDVVQPPKYPVLFGEKEGKIAKANRGKDPLFLFAALERQLGYPAVPRAKPQDPQANLLAVLERKVQQFEARLKFIEEEAKGGLDLTKLYVTPDPAKPEPGS